MRRARNGASLAIAALTAIAVSTSYASAGPSPVVQVSQGNPVAGCTAGTLTGHLNPSAEVEPYVAVNPNDPNQIIGTFQQNRFSNGGSQGGGVVFTHDGQHWGETMLPFGACVPGAHTPTYTRESDFWVSWGPDNVAYATALQVDRGTATPSNRVGMAAATTFDGGATWTNATGVIDDNDIAFFDDKNSITADPTRPGSAYLVWDRLFQPLDANGNGTAFDGPAMISITRDHGAHWSAPAVMVDTSTTPFTQTIGNIVLADPRSGKLYDVFEQQSYNDSNTDMLVEAHFAVTTSTDGGLTWSKPVKIANDSSVAEVDPNNVNEPLRTGAGLPSPAIDPVTGELYVAYEGSDFDGGAMNQIELTHSTDGGATWSAPTLASGDPNAAAFTPSVAVEPATGNVSIAYYDTRHLPAGDTTTLPTATWLRSFPRGHEDQATEHQIAPDFDWLLAPRAGGHMLGDYSGAAADGAFGVRPFFVTTQNAPADQTDVFTGVFHGPFSAPTGGAVIPPGLAAQMAGTHGAHKTAF